MSTNLLIDQGIYLLLASRKQTEKLTNCFNGPDICRISRQAFEIIIKSDPRS